MQTGESIFFHRARANRSPGLPRFSRNQWASKARGDRCVPIVLKLSDGIRAARAY